MSFLTIVSRKTIVRSSDGKTIPCDYLNHRRFTLACGLCAGLHYLFVRFSADRTYAKGYELRTAIKFFLDYVVEYEQGNPNVLHLSDLNHISPEVFYGYDSFVKKNDGPKGLATRLKSALKMVAQNFDEGMPSLILPLLDDSQSKVHEPLTEECFNQLSAALKSHINNLYKKLEFRLLVEEAQPYSFGDVLDVVEKPHMWIPDHARSLKTLNISNHPFTVSHEEYVSKFRSTQAAANRPTPQDIVELIYTRYNNPAIGRMTKIKKIISLSELLELFYPTTADQAAIALFLQLQTGWNKETVLALDGENFEHVLTGALNTSQALISSEKQKSQSTKNPFHSPKTFLAPSSKTDKYSAYRLVHLAKELSIPFSGFPVDSTSDESMRGQNRLFMAMRDFKSMSATSSRTGSRPGRYISLTHKAAWEGGVAAFLEKYEIREHGNQLRSVGEISGRLRPTWIRYMRDKNDRPLSVIALQQGHKSIETTDVHYDSSGPAMQLRRERLSVELNRVTDLLRNKQFKGLISRKDNAPPNMAALRIFTIPGHERSLWACGDSFKPDWPGSRLRVVTGEKCSEIPRCLFCSRIYIFEDSLPFLISRQLIIQEQLENLEEAPFNSPLSDELKIIEFIFDEWGDERALKEAARYVRQHPNLLPADMNSLTALLEE